MLDQNLRENINYFAALAQGVPFKDRGRDLSGWDCWGLIVNAYRDCFDLRLPDLQGVSALDAALVGAAFAEGCKDWREVEPGREQAGDVALFHRGRWPCHAGLVIKQGQVLHVDAEIKETCIEFFNRGILRRRLAGIFRHEKLGQFAS